MAEVNPTISVLTESVNRLNYPIKGTVVKSSNMLSTRDTLQIQRYK